MIVELLVDEEHFEDPHRGDLAPEAPDLTRSPAGAVTPDDDRIDGDPSTQRVELVSGNAEPFRNRRVGGYAVLEPRLVGA